MNPSSDSFDQAVQDVNKPADGGIVETSFVKKKYPLATQGIHKAICTKATLSDAPYPDAKPGEKVLRLWWQLDGTYEDEDGATQHYIIFSKSYALYFGPKSALSKLCFSLTGEPPIFEEKSEEKEGKTIVRRRFKYDVFVNMQCDLVVEHVTVKEKIYANAANYLTNDEQKRQNRQLLLDPSIRTNPLTAL